ncbi:MAG: hypothetical protein ACXAAI_11405 [Promethearchaeota archaeon]|jgi:hypothetical protein
MNVNKAMYSKFKQNNKKRSLRIKEQYLKKFVDYDKKNGLLYDNLYLNDIKFVVKIPFQDSRKDGSINNIRIAKFNLTDSIYISNYD